MREWYDGDDGDTGTLFRDIVLLGLAGFVAIVVILLPHINPPEVAEMEAELPPPGSVIVEMSWPDELQDDIDLWVKAPGDMPVGYSNKGGLYFNLLRDDLGHAADRHGINYETAYTRGRPAGLYIVNVHFFRERSGVVPIPVTVTVSVKNGDKTTRILEGEVELWQGGEERTVGQFKLDDEGRLVPGSKTTLHHPLRRVGGRQ